MEELAMDWDWRYRRPVAYPLRMEVIPRPDTAPAKIRLGHNFARTVDLLQRQYNLGHELHLRALQ